MKDPALTRHLRQALSCAHEAAIQGGAFLKKKYGKFKQITHKPQAGMVTEADHGSEKIILRSLKKKFPNDVFVGEESGIIETKRRARDKTPFRWHIDPLDGTTNFVHGFPMFCVSIGLEFIPDSFVLGVIYNPITEMCFYGHQGGGAFMNGKKIRVSKVAKVDDSLLTTGFSYRKEELFEKELKTFSVIAHKSHGIRRTGSAAMDLGFVSCGQLDGFWERGLNSWDIVAGLALVAEAGGKYSRFNGEPFRLGDQDLLVSNGKLHSEMVQLLKPTL